MPAELRPCRMVTPVAAIAAEARQVDTTDECHSIIDHDRLLVMAVKRPFAGVEGACDRPRPPEVVAHPSDGSAGWLEDGKWRTRPQEDAHVGTPCNLGQQVSQDDRPLGVAQHEVRGHEPPGQMDVRPSAPELVHDLGERGLAVDQHVDAIARPGRRRILGPAAGGRVEHGAGQASHPATMLRPHRRRDAVPDCSIDTIHHGCRAHSAKVPRPPVVRTGAERRTRLAPRPRGYPERLYQRSEGWSRNLQTAAQTHLVSARKLIALATIGFALVAASPAQATGIWQRGIHDLARSARPAKPAPGVRPVGAGAEHLPDRSSAENRTTRYRSLRPRPRRRIDLTGHGRGLSCLHRGYPAARTARQSRWRRARAGTRRGRRTDNA